MSSSPFDSNKSALWNCCLNYIKQCSKNLQNETIFIQKLMNKNNLFHLGDLDIGTALYNGPNTRRLTSFATGSVWKLRCEAITWFIVHNRERQTDYLLFSSWSSMFCFVNLVLYFFIFCILSLSLIVLTPFVSLFSL